MDSGVETGNDSNDSSVTQHDSIAMTSTGTFNQTQMNYNGSETVSAVNENSEPESSSTVIALPETADQVTLSEMSASNLNIQNSNLYSINTLALAPIFPLNLLPSETKLLEFRIPNLYSNECPVPSPAGIFRTKSCRIVESTYRKKTRDSRHESFYSNLIRERKLHIAARTNNIVLMQRLLDSGVSPNVANSHGCTALHIASSSGYTEMVSLLLRYGANPNKRDSIGNTPLHLAAVSSHVSIVTLLLNAGTNLLLLDCHGFNPLQLAQTKLNVMQKLNGFEMERIKDEVRNIIDMLMAYLQNQKDTGEQIETLSNFCSQLTLSSTSDQPQDDIRNLLSNIDSLNLRN